MQWGKTIKRQKIQLAKLNSIILDYQNKLDQRVTKIFSEILTLTKLVSDSSLTPIFLKTGNNYDHTRQQSFSHHFQNRVSKSFSRINKTNTSHISHIEQPYQPIDKLKYAFIQTGNQNVQNKIIKKGRAIGSKPVVRPKIIKRHIQVLPKQIRHNPFHQKNAIKSDDLDQGLLSLIQKGKIGRDVNVITAFQKGQPVFQTQKAIFHQGQQRFIELKSEQDDRNNKQKPKTLNSLGNNEKMIDNDWSITMPRDNINEYNNKKITKQDKVDNNRQFKYIPDKKYLKFTHFKMQKNQQYRQFFKQKRNLKGQIINVLNQLQKILKHYSINVGYIDCQKLVNLSTFVRKITNQQLINIIIGYQNKKPSIKTMSLLQQKNSYSYQKLKSIILCYFFRKKFLKYLLKRQMAYKICGFVACYLSVEKRKKSTKQRRQQILQKHEKLQFQLPKYLQQLQSVKHYQIHIVNGDNYQQITRIFNLRNPNKYIIFVLKQQIQQQTINYYFKIMELQDVPNYKERIIFLQADPSNLFPNSPLTQKLYYNSKQLRKLKRKILNTPAYLVLSYHNIYDIQLSVCLNIPILGMNIAKALTMQKRSNYCIKQAMSIQPHQFHSLIQMSDQISNFCTTKKNKRFVIKINNKYRSSGIALLSYPYKSLPQMLHSTSLVLQKDGDIQHFYHLLFKNGGIIQQYLQGILSVSAIIQINYKGQVDIKGTYQKISNGFINIAYNFPQNKYNSSILNQKALQKSQQFVQLGYRGIFQLSYFIFQNKIYLNKVQCFQTHLSSAICYYNFLCDGSFSKQGLYMAKITDTFQKDGQQQQIVTLQPRSFCYISRLMHMGLSQRQVNSFFQLCRLGGISFDLQNKHGTTFILVGSLKISIGLISTSRESKNCIRLMLKSLQFILKQSYQNMSAQNKNLRQQMSHLPKNIINVKQRLQDLV